MNEQHDMWGDAVGRASDLRFTFLAGHHRVVALGKLLTPMCLCHQAACFGTIQWTVMLFG